MIVEMCGEDYTSLLLGRAPGNYALADTPIGPNEILQMLADLAARIGAQFSPAAWMIVEQGEVVGLCSIKAIAEDGTIDIGYGIAPSRWNRGIAGRAIGEVLCWARTHDDVQSITAETTPANVASQRVLIRNGFIHTGERLDSEDGLVLCWRCETR